MANNIITNLHPDNDPNTNLYPNIKKENIPNKSISTDKLDDNVLSLIGSLKPSGTDTSTNILAYTSNKGIYVATDNGHWYYWNGSAYADGGVYLSDLSYDLITAQRPFEPSYFSTTRWLSKISFALLSSSKSIPRSLSLCICSFMSSAFFICFYS